jgi:hypothetical protein
VTTRVSGNGLPNTSNLYISPFSSATANAPVAAAAAAAAAATAAAALWHAKFHCLIIWSVFRARWTLLLAAPAGSILSSAGNRARPHGNRKCISPHRHFTTSWRGEYYLT